MGLDQDGGERSLWLQPLTWATIVFAVAALFAFTSSATDQPLRSVAIALLLGGSVVTILATIENRALIAFVGIGSLAAGVVLWIDPERFIEPVTQVMGVTVTAAGVLIGWRVRRWPGLGWPGAAVVVAIGLGMGALFSAYDRQLLPTGLGMTGTAFVAFAAIGIIAAGEDDRSRTISAGSAWNAASAVIAERIRPDGGAGRDATTSVEHRIVFEDEDRRRRFIRFYVLMGFASAIASFGVLTDSTAVVIGAMLIAPLLTPLMAMSLSLVSGWTWRLATAGATVLSGAGLTVLIGVLATAIAGRGTDVETNTQILQRTSPTLLDLAIALAAGAAGAYALSREDVSDSLPGVAVAIALVPPLAVVGVALQLGQWSEARGALYLFGTNALAILVMGAITFVLTGVAGVETSIRQPVGRWVVGFAALGTLVLWALVENSADIEGSGARTTQATEIVESWVAERDYDVVSIDVDDAEVQVVLTGIEFPDDPESLAAALQGLLGGEPVDLDLRVTLQERTLIEAEPAAD